MNDHEPKDNAGALFRNTRKSTEKQPDYKGEAIIGGAPVWVSGWLRKSKTGLAYMSLAFTAKDAPKADTKTQSPPSKPTTGQAHEAVEDGEIPF